MGEQIYITDVVKKLAQIKKVPLKKIKFKFIGLKKGEKLSEELSINKKYLKTSNRSIFIAQEPVYENIVLEKLIIKLKKSLNIKSELYLKKLIFNFLNKEVKF